MWLLKLKRMMDEVPQEFLEPRYFEGSLSPEKKLVGQLSDEEKRLLGVVYWLQRKMELEIEAHEILHDDPNYPLEDCLKFSIGQYPCECEAHLVSRILVSSIQERLSLHQSDFFFHGYEIYSSPNPVIERMKADFEIKKQLGGPANVEVPFFGPLLRLIPRRLIKQNPSLSKKFQKVTGYFLFGQVIF